MNVVSILKSERGWRENFSAGSEKIQEQQKVKKNYPVSRTNMMNVMVT